MSGDDEPVTETTEEKDDRWSGFVDPVSTSSLGAKKQREPPQDLSEYICKVLKQQSPREKQEKQYKVAATVMRLVANVAYAMDTEWKTYVAGDPKNMVKMMPLRTLSEEKYECMIPLIRPMRLDGFKVIQKGKDEMLPHRCLVQVNPALSKEEATLVHNEWTPYINKQGCLRPRSILKWFNNALNKACSVVFKDNHNIDLLTCTEGRDGTARILVTATEYDGTELEISKFSVNMFPVYVMDALPSSMKLTAPLPCFGTYIHGQKEFRELVLKDLEFGKHIAVLDPKAELGASVLKYSKPEVDRVTWKINLSFTEYHVYSLIDKYCRGLNFRQVLVLFNILREQYTDELSILNNEILVNTLFLVSQRHIDKLHATADWFHKVSQALCDGLESGFLPCFYLPRQNLLKSYNVSDRERQTALDKLSEMFKNIKETPESLCDYTGYEEKKKGKDDDDSDSDDEDNDGGRDGNGNVEAEEVKGDNKDVISVNDEVKEPCVPAHHVLKEDEPESVRGSLTYVGLNSNKGQRSDIY